MVSKTVMLELEWVMRDYYKFDCEDIVSVLRSLISFPNIAFKDLVSIAQAIDNLEQGLDFADALHHARYRCCEAVVSFDDKKFSNKAAKCLDPIDHKLYKFGKLYRARQVLRSLMTDRNTIDEHS